MSIGIGIKKYSLVLKLVFNSFILDLDLYTDLNEVVVLKEPVFDNELFTLILYVKITYFSKIGTHEII